MSERLKKAIQFCIDKNVITHLFGFALLVFAAYGFIKSGYKDYLGAGTFLAPGVSLVGMAHGWGK